ncbi:MAG: hypothetical protein ACE5GB_10750 [Acidimicrobiales bacterium]
MSTRPGVEDRLDRTLAALTGAALVGHRGSRRLVVSRAGVFVLDPALDGIPIALASAARLAADTRDLLTEHLTWVPFVDWLVVSDDGEGFEGPVVPHDLVASTVLQGHAVDPGTVRRISALLESGALAPSWHADLPRAGDGPTLMRRG